MGKSEKYVFGNTGHMGKINVLKGIKTKEEVLKEKEKKEEEEKEEFEDALEVLCKKAKELTIVEVVKTKYKYSEETGLVYEDKKEKEKYVEEIKL